MAGLLRAWQESSFECFCDSGADYIRRYIQYNAYMPGELMEHEISEIPGIFEKLLDDRSTFITVGKYLNSKSIHSVLILARGTSDNAAHFLKYLIETQLGLPVGLTSPSSVTLYNSKLHFEGVLVVALSQSGQSPDLVAYAKSAMAAGASLISLTNDANSPLAKSSNFHVDLQAGPEIAVAATKSYAAQLLASYLIVCAWKGVKPDSEDLVQSSSQLLEVDFSDSVEACDIQDEIVVLGRGFSYPNARETALKIQETNKVSVQGLSTADYMHGPISALSPRTQVFFLAPTRMPSNSMDESVQRIRNMGAKIFWLGGGAQVQAGEKFIGGSSINNEIVASIADAVLLQRFVLALCLKNSMDPDSPQGLSKVTRTY